mmetsp:Transcript_17274/g.60726  ORF Transcript_17274/g.60726 Transcript_17274/m.60726 type:complete len:103 (-) Transcript_17274:114-422(-)|eukprot:CAMPEP_0203809370 /NCGR_PEP_ID=MMETSP0115-20131106/2239_1 /ASSEMBLY_ACC=CAM_ASM_000227 /TAXON_ID=33651 /ORGANISM="Bicosoecid sp, Strain ms1" /LENGTH=102 /DNA_ID=CAMNT_0050718099 /DNA_START=205 /DNA_END=513 /DNA_ORIENTATION=-
MAKELASEVARNHNWADRVNSEINAQINFASEWGSTLPGAALPTTIEEAIERKEAELREAKARCEKSVWETTASGLGAGPSLDTFKTDFGKKRLAELTPADE